METAPPNSETSLRFSPTKLAATTHTPPVRLEELASKCSFLHDTPHYIQFLCSIPNSPLLLTAERLVTFSKAGFVAITQFFANSDFNSIYFDSPEFVPQSLKVVASNELVETYCRRRKRMRPEVENLSVMKKRIFKDFSEGENSDRSEYVMPSSFQNVHTHEYLLNGELSRNTMSLSNILLILTLECQEQPKVISTTPVYSISGQLGPEIENNGHENKGMGDSFLNWNGFGFAHPDYEFCGRIPLLKPLAIEQIMKYMPPPRFSCPQQILGLPNVSQVCKIQAVNSLCGAYVCSSSQLEVDQQITDSQAKREAVVEACTSLTTDFNEEGKELSLRDSGRRRGHKEILPLRKYESGSKNVAEANYAALLQDKSRTKTHHTFKLENDLFDIKYMLPVKLLDWCVQNTRRPQFLENIPKSLLDLLDKCLTVNSRLRISAEEALKHEFFASYHVAVRKQKLHRQGTTLSSHAPTMSST